MWNRASESNGDDREAQVVATWMTDLAALPVTNAPLPDPTYLWWKAELLRRWDAQQRATQPIEVGEQVEVGVGLAAATGLLIWLWRTLPGLTLASATTLPGASLVTGLTVSAVLLAVTAGLMVRNLVRN